MQRTRFWLLIVVTVLIIGLAGAGAALAGPPTPTLPQPLVPVPTPVGPQGNHNEPDGTTPDASIQLTPLGTMNYQGKLLQDGNPYSGNIDITFRLYKQESGGSAFWSETQTVAVSDGLFNVTLGEVTPMADAQEFYQQVWIGVQPAGASAELTPRQPLGAVGYAQNLLPGATMIDPGLTGYGTSFFVNSHDHPAIYGRSDTHDAITGEVTYTDTAAIVGNSWGPGGTGVYGYAEDNGRGVEGYGVGSGGLWSGGTGVYGDGSGGFFSTGVYGRGDTWGVYGTSDHYGVTGYTTYTGSIGLYGLSTGDDAYGVYGETTGDSTGCPSGSTKCASGVYGTAGGDAYGSFFYGENRTAIIGIHEAVNFYGLWLNSLVAPDDGGLWANADSYFGGYVTFSGGKSGYVVDIARNGGTEALERGDVVVIAGYDTAVVGDVPVIVVAKATEANATDVVGVVDIRYTPCDRPAESLESGERCGGYDHDGTTIQPGEYLSVVTLGSYAYLKVDATSGPIRPGDLLASAPAAGYATKAPLLTVEGVSFHAPGTVIGKALGSLDEGTGVIPVFVSAR